MLLKINGEKVRDKVDYMFKLSAELVELEFQDPGGKRHKFLFEHSSDPGLTFEEDRICRCKSNCIFCFVHQQPKGMRRSLYIKDDDYRLSFTHGNFISFSSLSDDDIERIVEQRLSPLYISVHSTDDKLRQSIFRNRKLAAIIPQLKDFIDKGIRFHTQVVVCPGINDGGHLEKTVDDLFALYPGVATLGIVPVGLTKYRKKLPEIKAFNRQGATEIVAYIQARQKEFLRKCGSRFVFAADEFYILSGYDFPRISEYEEMEQFENGIGMMRQLLTDFNRRKRHLRKLKKRARIVLLTGEGAFDALRRHAILYLKQNRFEIDIAAVKNRFWGKRVTVSGLLTGRDLLNAAKKMNGKYDIALLPPNCLNNDNLFLDDVSLDQFRKRAGIEVKVGRYSMIDTLNEVLG